MENDDLKLELPNFQGPLDLLLHLIKVQKIDIYDIPIAKITRQYMAYLQRMQSLNLQIAGEYFLMSATLLRIKSQYLLPKNDFEDDVAYEEDPRDELVEQLIQYSVFKKASEYFKEREQNVPIIVSKEPSTSSENKLNLLPKGKISVSDLTAAFATVVRKQKLRQPVAAEVKLRAKSIPEMISFLQEKLTLNQKVSFFACLNNFSTLADAIALFLATLELCKNHQATAWQIDNFEDIQLEKVSYNG